MVIFYRFTFYRALRRLIGHFKKSRWQSGDLEYAGGNNFNFERAS